ncbi:MAG: peptide chain release factor N(5)-glutamine methyltransferase [Planctomycetota bacterium]
MSSESWTILKLIEWTRGYLERAHVENPRLDAEVLLAHVLDLTRIQLYTSYSRVPTGEELAKFRELIKRRAAGEPTQYLTQSSEFYSIALHVDNRVLVPRPETELLVDVALACVDDRSASLAIGDLCTGSGCVAIALATSLPGAVVHAVDSSADALEVARRNVHATRLSERVRVLQGDLTGPLRDAGLLGAIDMIVSNPPYVRDSEVDSLPREVRDHEPRAALVAGPRGTEFHERIAHESRDLLRENGPLILEIAESQGAEVAEILKCAGFRDVKLMRDYAGRHRVASARK